MTAAKLEALKVKATTLYRFTHKLNTRQRAAATRAELKRARELAKKLFDWITSEDETAAGDAIRLVRTSAMDQGCNGRQTISALQDALCTFLTHSHDAERLTSSRKPVHSAPLYVAAMLWAELPGCGIKVTAYATEAGRASAAVTLLRDIARAAGDKSLTLAAAKKALMETRPQ